MTEQHVNNELMYRIGFSKVDDIEEYRKIYYNLINIDEKDFFYSMLSWWNDGNAPYYDRYLEKTWKEM